MVYRFVENGKNWGSFDDKDKASNFLDYIKTLKGFEDFTILKYLYNSVTNELLLSAVIPIKSDTVL